MTQPPPHPGFQLASGPPHQPGPFGAAAPMDPAPPGPKAGRKTAARSIDAAIWALVVALVATATFQSIGERASNLVPSQAIGAVVDVLFSGGDVGAAADEVGTSVWNMVVSRIRLSIFILIGLHLLYETAANLWKGRTLGRMLLDLRIDVRGRPGVGVARAITRAVVTVACTGSLYGLAWIVLLHGSFMGGLALWLLSVAALIAYALPALIGPGRRSLADLVAGTRVVHAGVYARAGQAAVQTAQAGAAATRSAADAARRGMMQAGDQIPVQRLSGSEPVRRVRETGGRWAAQAAESDQGRRLRRLGSDAKDRAKEAYRQRKGDERPPTPG